MLAFSNLGISYTMQISGFFGEAGGRLASLDLISARHPGHHHQALWACGSPILQPQALGGAVTLRGFVAPEALPFSQDVHSGNPSFCHEVIFFFGLD